MGCALTMWDKGTRKHTAFICGPGITPCPYCGSPADYLCDYPTGEGRTCDIWLCEHHRIRQGGDLQNLDFCPQHSLIARGVATVPDESQLKGTVE